MTWAPEGTEVGTLAPCLSPTEVTHRQVKLAVIMRRADLCTCTTGEKRGREVADTGGEEGGHSMARWPHRFTRVTQRSCERVGRAEDGSSTGPHRFWGDVRSGGGSFRSAGACVVPALGLGPLEKV